MSAPRNASHVQYIRLPRRISFRLPRVNPPNKRMLLPARSGSIEVKEPRDGVQLLFQNQHAFVLDDVADLAMGIEDVAELTRAHRADFDAGGVAALARALDTEGALLDHALGPRAVAEVVGVGIDFVFGNGRGFPVEVPRAVGAGRHAVAAADAPVVIDDHDAVLLSPGGACRADLGAGRILALLAADGDVEVAFFGDLGRIVVGVGVGEVDALFLLHGEDADPVDLRVARLVVFGDAAVDAAAAADAAGDIEREGEMDTGHRALLLDLDFLPKFFFERRLISAMEAFS